MVDDAGVTVTVTGISMAILIAFAAITVDDADSINHLETNDLASMMTCVSLNDIIYAIRHTIHFWETRLNAEMEDSSWLSYCELPLVVTLSDETEASLVARSEGQVGHDLMISKWVATTKSTWKKIKNNFKAFKAKLKRPMYENDPSNVITNLNIHPYFIFYSLNLSNLFNCHPMFFSKTDMINIRNLRLLNDQTFKYYN